MLREANSCYAVMFLSSINQLFTVELLAAKHRGKSELGIMVFG